MREKDLLRHSSEVEVKWAVYAAGEKRPHWAMQREATSLAVLIRGLFQISFAEADVLLSKEGDYAIWGAGVAHTWAAEEDSVILTLRWPSRPEDSLIVPNPRAQQHETKNFERSPRPLSPASDLSG